ncbi:hypothetical protein SDC9_212082 [bioreactor metagenome]|uniref:Uncharacterized protein n=1 Tax=bioreactor metagenome TaxID=1076179 RepID=A0A645JL46_9ZZZZ
MRTFLEDFRLAVGLAEVFLQIHAGGPRIAGAGQHQDHGLLVEFQRLQHVDHFAIERRAHRVALFRAVQRDPGNAFFELDLHAAPAAFILGHILSP